MTDMTVHTKQTLATDRMCIQQKTADRTLYKTMYWKNTVSKPLVR